MEPQDLQKINFAINNILIVSQALAQKGFMSESKSISEEFLWLSANLSQQAQFISSTVNSIVNKDYKNFMDNPKSSLNQSEGGQEANRKQATKPS